MADRKISQFSALAKADVVTSTDYLPIIDASAVDASKNKKITVDNLVQSVNDVQVSTALLSATAAHTIPVNVESLSGTKALTITDKTYQLLNPNGSARDVTLPNTNLNYAFVIKNTGTAGNALTVKDSAATTIISIYNGESFTLVQIGSNSWTTL